jgi:hypothetical protein
VVITIGAARFLPERIDDVLQQGRQPVVHVTARLALSPPAAVELINALNNILGAMTKGGPCLLRRLGPLLKKATNRIARSCIQAFRDRESSVRFAPCVNLGAGW